MRTSTRIFSFLAIGTILCAGSAFGARFELVGSDPTPVPITGPTFVFNANAAGGGAFEFSNLTGGVLTSLTFLADIPRPDPAGCSAPQFSITSYRVAIPNVDNYFVITSDCDVTSGIRTAATVFDHFALYILGTSVPPYAGPEVGVFTLILNDDGTLATGGTGGWGGATFQGQVTSVVPEPATYGLIGAGLAGLAIARRRRSA